VDNFHTDTLRKAGIAQAIVLICATVLPIMGVVSLAPVLPSLLEHFKMVEHSEFLVPAALTVPGLMIALFSTTAGLLADRYGRKKLLLGALLLYAVFGMLPLLFDSLHAIVASRAALGVAEAFIMTIATTLAGDYFSPEQRKKIIAIQAAVGSLAASVLFGAGGALGGISWKGPFWLYGLSLLVLIAVFVFIWEPRTETQQTEMEKNQSSVFPWKSLGVVCLVTLFSAVIFYIAPIHLGVVMNSVGVVEPPKIGAAIGLGSLGVPLGAFLYHRISHLSNGYLMGASLLLCGIGLAGMPYADTYGEVVGLFFVNQLGSGMLLPILINWCLSVLPFSLRGRGVGIWNSTFFIGQFISPLLLALIGNQIGGLVSGMMLLGMFSILVAGVCALIFHKRVPTLH
jgi:MFS family permease